MRKMATVVLLINLAALLTGCRFGGVVIGDIVTGPTVIDEIRVPIPTAGGTPQLVIGMGGGELSLSAGNTDNLVEGTVAYNVTEIKPNVQVQDNQVRIEQGDIEGRRIPIGNWNDVVNKWDLTLGTEPMVLTVNAGAARAQMVRLADLGAPEIHFNGGAGDFTLDFSGSLRQDMQVSIDAGAAQVAVVVPEGTAAELRIESALTDITAQGAWQKAGSGYVQAGSGPKITFVIKMGVGRLELRNR